MVVGEVQVLELITTPPGGSVRVTGVVLDKKSTSTTVTTFATTWQTAAAIKGILQKTLEYLPSISGIGSRKAMRSIGIVL